MTISVEPNQSSRSPRDSMSWVAPMAIDNDRKPIQSRETLRRCSSSGSAKRVAMQATNATGAIMKKPQRQP